MLLTITTTHQPASDLGYLLHKHPDKFQSVALSVGKAHIYYPKSSEEETTIALLLDIDPIDMVRGARNMGGKGFSLGQYVNDRPYVASSFMSVAISKAFSTAMNGACKDRPDLPEKPLPLEAKIAVLPAPQGGESLIKKLFEPLGYTTHVTRHTLDSQFEAWGDSKYYTVTLTATITLKDLLAHLYVLIPALDNDKHYFVSQNEVDKLLERGKGWLEHHPEKERITRRYLINLNSLAKQAINRLNETEAPTNVDDEVDNATQARKATLHQKRLEQVLAQLIASGATSVIDLGCGEGKLLSMLIKEKQFEKIAGMDVSYQSLLRAKERLHWDTMAPKLQSKLNLFHGALTYRDQRFKDYDAAAIVEVIEHMDENRLDAFERVVFEVAKPKTVIITTPNAEYNVLYETLEAGTMRHTDHRFEWSRKQFEAWASGVAQRNGYQLNILPIGEPEAAVGAPSQMGIFTYED